MCAHHSHHRHQNFLFQKSFFYILAISLSIFSGLSDVIWLHQFGTIISDTFIKIFKFISIPLISLSIIVTISQNLSEHGANKIWQRTLFYTITTTLIAASVSCILFLIISPSNVSILPAMSETATQMAEKGSYWGFLSQIIPLNPFAPYLEQNVLSALLVSLLVGIAIRYIPEEKPRETLFSFFKGIHSVFLIITGWVVKILPLALFGFITTTLLEIKNGTSLGGLGGYLSVIVVANLVQGLFILPLFLRLNGIQPFPVMKGMLPALSVAFFSKSSAGTLPITMAAAENNLGINPKISRFVLPLCTSINMNGCAAFIFATVIYLMQNNGMVIDGITMLVWIFIATLAAIGNAGVPMGCFFLSASLLTSMNVPIALLGLILPFYSLIDMLETSLNVWSDACVTKVIDKKVNLNE